MGSPPPVNFPPPSAAQPSFPASPKATPCSFSLPFTIPGLPPFTPSFKLPSIPSLPGIPTLPIPFVAFKFSCDPTSPVDVTAGLPAAYSAFGGGRVPNAPPDQDLDEATP